LLLQEVYKTFYLRFVHLLHLKNPRKFMVVAHIVEGRDKIQDNNVLYFRVISYMFPLFIGAASACVGMSEIVGGGGGVQDRRPS
jgi:hypothetical protein